MTSVPVFREKFGTRGPSYAYAYFKGSHGICREVDDKLKPNKISRILQELFLPYGFPESVSEDYITYQIWDTVQAFCSTLSGILTTQAVMKGVGVGDEVASPLAATITWILKDGVGMIVKIAFAWWKGTCLDYDFKKWRFVADVINDCAIFLELLLFYYSGFSTMILCLSSTLRTIVGVAGGATRAAITHHQAIHGNLADVSAKDGSQETCVNLFAMACGLILLTCIDTRRFLVPLFLFLAALHIYSNYRAVSSVVMKTFNAARYRLLLRMYLTKDKVAEPKYINQQEPILLGFGINDTDICGSHIHMGTTIQNINPKRFRGNVLGPILELYRQKKYIVVQDYETNVLHVIVHKAADSNDVLQSYFHAAMMGVMATAIASKDADNSRAMGYMKHVAAGNIVSMMDFERRARKQHMYLQTVVNRIVETEFQKFRKLSESKGWSFSDHNLVLDEWRGEW